MYIRETAGDNLDNVLHVERLAFGYDKEAELVRDLQYYPRYGFSPAGDLKEG